MMSDQNFINLTKQVGIVLEKRKLKNVRCQVVVLVDVSGSMTSLFGDGTVQTVSDRMFAIAWVFDDNQTLECWAFDDKAYELPSITEANYADYVKKNIIHNKDIEWGGTNYTPALKAAFEHFFETTALGEAVQAVKSGWAKLNPFAKKAAVAPVIAPVAAGEPQDPVFVLFLTDGSNGDVNATEEFISNIGDHNIYIQSIGIGHNTFTTLKNLRDKHENVGFFDVKDIAKINNDELYSQIIDEKFVAWYNKRTVA